MTKQRLGYYYDLFPDTRHALLRPLLDVNWSDHVTAIRQAVESGATLVLTGEDVDLHPGSGLDVYPHRDAYQLGALHAALDGAKWTQTTSDGDTISASLGKGRLLLCRESINAAGHDNAAIASWQQRWLSGVNSFAAQAIAIPAPTRDELARWWTGQQAICGGRRSVTWFADDQRQVKLTLDPKQPLRDVVLFTVPPTGNVERIQLSVAASGDGVVSVDVGCDGAIDGEIRGTATGVATQLDLSSCPWLRTLAQGLDSTARRDGSRWRKCPVRLTATAPVEMIVSELRITVRED